MIRELKYLFYLIVIFFFIFFILRFYFSDENKKKNFRSINILEEKIEKSEKDLILLKNNTENIIEYVENVDDKKTKKYSFWKLLYND